MRSPCPKCNNLLETPSTWQNGQAVRCPHCQTVFVPTEAPQAPAPPEPPLQQQAGAAPASSSRDTPWAIVLLIIGLVDILDSMAVSILARVIDYSQMAGFLKFWANYYGYLILPVLAVVCSFFYFADKRRAPKRIAWEYLGIIPGYTSVIFALHKFLLNLIFR